MVKEIKICMGSACFARGNNRYCEIIDKFIKDNGLEANIEFYGEHCNEKCDSGPNIYIDNVCYSNIDDEKLNELLNELK